MILTQNVSKTTSVCSHPLLHLQIPSCGTSRFPGRQPVWWRGSWRAALEDYAVRRAAGGPVSQWECRRKWPTNGTYIKEEEQGVSNEGMDHSAQWLTHTQQLHSKTESPGSRLWLSLQRLPPCPLLMTLRYQAPGLLSVTPELLNLPSISNPNYYLPEQHSSM